MSTKSVTKARDIFPSVFDDFFKPWSEWMDVSGNFSRMLTVPAVNIIEEKDGYKATLAVPGMDKKDFKVDVDGNILSISAQKEETKEEGDKKYNRREYNYSSFTRSFTLPKEVNQQKIDASYSNGVLTVILPKAEVAKAKAKAINVK